MTTTDRCAKRKGFTLIELMMVIAIIAFLSLLAYPSYVEQVRRSRRAQAQSDLLSVAQTLERFHTERNTYDGFATGAVLPADVGRSPAAGPDIFYNLSLTAAATATAFTLQAVPIGDQAADRCGTLTIDQAGVRTPNSGATEDCWAGGR